MHPRQFDILTRLRDPESELRVIRGSGRSYSAEIATVDSGAGGRVAARHAIDVIRHRHVEPVGDVGVGPGWAGIYRLAERGRDHSEPAYREELLITTCALRFDGYRYIEEEGIGMRREEDDDTSWLDLTAETEAFFTRPDYDAPLDYQRMMLFLVQRNFIREGCLRWTSQLARLTRQLFVRTCRGEVPVHLRVADWADSWDAEFAPYVKDHIRFVEGRDRETVYDELLF